MGDKWLNPAEISAIFAKIKADAEAKLGEPITEAILPAGLFLTTASAKPLKNCWRNCGL